MKTSSSSTKHLHAFTLIELLVVVSIIAVLASLLLPSLTRARASAKKALCASNLKQLGIANHMYADESDDWFPNAQHTSAAVFWVDTKSKADFDSFFPDLKIFQCPDTKYMHNDLPQYGPGWRLNNGINATYRFYAARGSIHTAASYYIYNGFYILGTRPSTPDSPFCAACPKRTMCGSMVRDVFAEETLAKNSGAKPYTYYIHEPSDQPAVMDGRHGTNDQWIIYASYRFVQNNHITLNGMNVCFMDGHIQWGNQLGDSPRMYVGYWDGLMRW